MAILTASNGPELAEKHPKETQNQLQVSINKILRRDCKILLLHSIFEQKLKSKMSIFDFVDLLAWVGLVLLLELFLAKKLNKIYNSDTIRKAVFEALDLQETDEAGVSRFSRHQYMEQN